MDTAVKSADPAGEPVAPLYEGLPSGPRRASDAEVTRHRRERLLGAMLAAVSRRGYAGVTLSELVALAGVSKSTFYEIFESKEECFWAAFDEIVTDTAARAWQAYGEGDGLRDGLLRALLAYGETVAGKPDAASFTLVESLGLGTTGAARREAGIERFEELLRRGLESDGGGLSELEIRGVLGGGRRVVYRCLREGHPERFSEHAEELLSWALGYRERRELSLATTGGGGESEPPGSSALGDEGERGLLWSESPAGARARATLSQRERIMRAVAQLAGECGYSGLSVPAISGAAGVSNQTFYHEFAGKQEAFLAAFEALAAAVLERTEAAFARHARWLEGVDAGLRVLLSFIAANPELACFAFFELAAAGPAGRDASERATQRTMAFLAPDSLPPGIERLPPVVVEAIGGGIWTIVQHEIVHDRTRMLPRLAPALLDFVFAPLKRVP